MTEKEIITNLSNKIQNSSYSKNMNNAIYNYFVVNNNISWDARNTTVMGMGEVEYSNNELLNSNVGIDLDNMSSTFQFLILKNNTSGDFVGLLLPPIPKHKHSPTDPSIFGYDFPNYEYVSDGFINKDNWLFSNILEEEVEVVPWAFKKQIPFSSLLSPKQLELNDKLVESIKNKQDLPLLSELIENSKERNNNYVK